MSTQPYRKYDAAASVRLFEESEGEQHVAHTKLGHSHGKQKKYAYRTNLDAGLTPPNATVASQEEKPMLKFTFVWAV